MASKYTGTHKKKKGDANSDIYAYINALELKLDTCTMANAQVAARLEQTQIQVNTFEEKTNKINQLLKLQQSMNDAHQDEIHAINETLIKHATNDTAAIKRRLTFLEESTTNIISISTNKDILKTQMTLNKESAIKSELLSKDESLLMQVAQMITEKVKELALSIENRMSSWISNIETGIKSYDPIAVLNDINQRNASIYRCNEYTKSVEELCMKLGEGTLDQ